MKLRHTLLIGPPGTGKTLWAKMLWEQHAGDVDGSAYDYTYRCAGMDERLRPSLHGFRAPHHTVSAVGIFGSLRGHRWTPGEVSLAAGGILFLDDLPEFSRHIVEALRGPMENGTAMLASRSNVLHVPANFTLVASANPCPCGWYQTKGRACTCPASTIKRYQARIPQWLRDMCVTMGPHEYGVGDAT